MDLLLEGEDCNVSLYLSGCRASPGPQYSPRLREMAPHLVACNITIGDVISSACICFIRVPQLEHGAATVSREKRTGRGKGRGRGKRSRSEGHCRRTHAEGMGRSRRSKSRHGHSSEASLGLLDARPNVLDGVTLSKERLDTMLEEAEARKRGYATLVFAAAHESV